MKYRIALASVFMMISAANAEPAPGNVQSKVANYIRQTFKDPSSMTDTSLSAPYVLKSRTWNGQWAVCLRTNAKNSYGGYVGLRDYIFIFKGGEIVDTMGGAWVNSELCQSEPKPFRIKG